jgi:hypothetical protein
VTRQEAFDLACEVADKGYSVSIAIGVHKDHMPRENISVHVHTMRFESQAFRQLLDIADAHELELHMIGTDLRFVKMTEQQRRMRDVT